MCSIEKCLLMFYAARSVVICAVLTYALLVVCKPTEPIKILPFQLYAIFSFFASTKAVIGFEKVKFIGAE